MKQISVNKIRSSKLFKFSSTAIYRPSTLAKIIHVATLVIVPFIALLLVRADITALAVLLVLLSKWRVLAVKPRFWLANIRSDAIDIVVGLSTVVFLVAAAHNLPLQLVWTIIYVAWLVFVKPSSKIWLVGLQAIIGEAYGLIALSIAMEGLPLFLIAFAAGLICYIAAHHFFDVFDEEYTKLLSYLWAAFGAATSWLLGHLLFFYGPLSQPALLILATSFGAATLYYLDHFDKSSKLARRQVALLILVIVLIILIKLIPLMFYVWSDKVL